MRLPPASVLARFAGGIPLWKHRPIALTAEQRSFGPRSKFSQVFVVFDALLKMSGVDPGIAKSHFHAS
jgi:hypothetical protein